MMMIEIPQLAAVHPPAQMIVKESPKVPDTEHTTHMILAELPKVLWYFNHHHLFFLNFCSKNVAAIA
jgi:hypothetical protein